MKKIMIVIGLLVILGIVGAILIIGGKDKKFNAYGIVTKVVSNTEVEIKEDNKIIGKAVIKLPIFDEGDKLEVAGLKKDYLVIDKVTYLNNDNNKQTLINNINNDLNLNGYKNNINIVTKKNNEEGPAVTKTKLLPLIVEKQEYDLNISAEDLFPNIGYTYNANSDIYYEFTSSDKFIVKEVKAIYDDKEEKLEYEFKDEILTFKNVGKVIYSVIIEYSNGDIINYFFI